MLGTLPVVSLLRGAGGEVRFFEAIHHNLYLVYVVVVGSRVCVCGSCSRSHIFRSSAAWSRGLVAE